MEFPDTTLENKDCPDGTSILCGKKTLARGLCVAKKEECHTRKQSSRPILKTLEDAAGWNYGYVSDFLGRGCYVPTASMKIDYQRSYTRYDSVPESFNLMTYNIWGLSSKERLVKLFKLRKPLLLGALSEGDADMFCLQEMSKEAYAELEPWINKYPFASERPMPANKSERNRNVEVYFVSRYRPKKVTVYGIVGVLGYDNSLLVITYPNLVIFNLYNQAGSRHSIGQEKTWIHYSRCRYDILNMIYDMLPPNVAVIVCGDFNFDLDGSVDMWPELEMIDRFKAAGFIDTYRRVHKTGGLTENTDENLMRWNQKLVTKKYRYDGILYRPAKHSWSVIRSQLIGRDLEYLNEADSQWFYDTISEAHKMGGIRKLRGVYKTRKGMRIPINASDHFGVITRFRERNGSRTRKNTMTNHQ